jgi:hypothetical protein
MEKSESIKELATALAKAQLSVQAALKDATNPHFGKKYADLSAVWAACREPLGSNGLSVVQMPTDAEPGRVALETLLMHSSGEYIRSTCSTRIMKDDAQGVGSGITYLRRYALAAVVGVVADEDDDGNGASQQPGRPQQQPQRPAPTQQTPAPTADFLGNLEKALAARGMADSKCLSALQWELNEKAKAQGKTFDFDKPAPQTAAAVLKQIESGKFDHLKEAA